MNTRMSLSWLACAGLCLTQVAHAGPGAGYYPHHGYVVHSLPYGRHAVIAPGGGHYFYSRGVWYAPHGPNYVVVHAPVGVFVPILPPFYTTVWFGGARYYYADDSYYLWRDHEHAYEVVDPPEQTAAIANSSSSDDVFMYPKSGQSADQQAKDRFECHRWASGETQFDPTQPGGGVPDEQNSVKRNDYRRAITACLEGRGYSVK